jgi:hypothetical protein
MMKSPTHSSRKPGFALIVTLSLMILLTVIAVGLLTLSSISLRSSSQGLAQAEAQANARLALLLALGDLQKSLGPDRAVTATSEILATPAAAVAKPNITGVWESWWDFNPNSSPAPVYRTEKTNRFRRWLVSSADMAEAESRDFATTAWTGKTIELVGSGSLGTSATASATAAAKVTAGLVPVSKNGRVQGSYAWHVADESVKARINLYRDPAQNTTLAQKRALLAGHRPDPSVIKGPDGSLLSCLPTDMIAADFATATANAGKIISLGQAELLDNAKDKIKPLRNDITPYSLGVLADVRGGGLKQDLSSMFEMGSATSNTLPADFTSKKLYQSTHGITGVSDPNWSALAGYYNSFLSVTSPETKPTYATKSSSTNTQLVPTGYNPMPVVAKVEMIYSLVARPCTEVFWYTHDSGNNGALDLYDYFLCLILTPVVTLHNPYNVHIQFHSMKVSFKNIPVAFRFMYQKNSSGAYLSQSVNPDSFESYNQMMWPGMGADKHEFGIRIANWADTKPISSSTVINSPINLRPGQTIICGTYLDPTASLKRDAGLHDKTQSFDWLNILSKEMKARPSFVPGLGFETWGVTMAHTVDNHPNAGGSWCSNQMLRDQSPGPNPKISKTTATDKFYVEYKIERPKYWTNWSHASLAAIQPGTPVQPNFAVTAEIQATINGPFESCAKIAYDYKDDPTLQSIFNNRTYRYPPTDGYKASDLAAPGAVLYNAQSSYVHPFAVFSAYARTTNGGVYETGKRTKSGADSPQVNLLKDGGLGGTPFLFHNSTRSNFTIDLAAQKPSAQAYELNFQPFLSKGDFQDYMDVDAINRVPSLSGNKTTSGIKSGSYLEFPSGPLISIADFRRSNALATAYPPHFVQPVANSRLHPLMSPDKVSETNTSIATDALLDHSFLANHALYDRFYFSTFARRGTTRADSVFEQFMNGTAPLALQAFQPYLPVGKSVTTAKAELFASGKPNATAYKNAAEYQMIRGPFNVNSTSVQAWKAALASMNKSDVATLWARSSALETKAAGGVPIPAMSLLNGGANRTAAVDATKIDNEKSNNWNGYRVLTESELENLATKIVAEVRDRGPFLSMSEFVNRQVGPLGPRTLAGALESAIAESEINEKKNATSADSFLSQVPITATDVSDPKLYNYKTPEATTGNPAAGAPGWVSQGDLLRILEPAATVRGDTFVIRTYGEARDVAGNIIARAYAEAVVQRVPEYVDPADRPSLNPYTDPTASAANKTFGRRINVVSFRWLSTNEI